MVPDEEKVIDAVINGDANSFSLIVDAYKNMVFTLCIQLMKDNMLAEEIAQDVFLKAYRNLHAFKRESKFSTWLYKIAYNTCLSALRKKKIEFGELNESIHGNDSNNAFDELVKEDRNSMIKDLLLNLKEDDRVIIQLFFLEEQSIKEIAHITGMTDSNIKVKLHRSKAKLKGLIEESYPELNKNGVY